MYRQQWAALPVTCSPTQICGRRTLFIACALVHNGNSLTALATAWWAALLTT
jgi:hypothetical protein